MTVYVVRYSNYDPPEADSLWASRDDAEQHAKAMNEKSDGCGWEVTAMPVYQDLGAFRAEHGTW